MNYATSMLPVLLPIALFVVTLFIIFTLRAGDKRSKSLSNVKKLLDIYKGNIEASDASFKQYASELEQEVSKRGDEVRDLIKTVTAQIAELRSYSDDLMRLKNAMETYREALEGLARLTADADDKVQTVQNEVDRLDKVRAVIDGFRRDMKDADEHLRKHEQRVIQLERESIGRMNDAVSETDSSMDEAMAGLHKECDEVLEAFKERTSNDTEFRLRKLDDAFQAVIHTVQQFFGELENKIDEARIVADRLRTGDVATVIEPSRPFEPEVPSMVAADIADKTSGEMQRTDLKGKIDGLSQPAPENVERPKPSMPSFKAPKFTPKTEEEIAREMAEADDGADETDADDAVAFGSFGGVDEPSSDYRGMDILDMDFSASRKEPKPSRWQTYGDEEVVPFDDDTDSQGR